LIEKFLEKTPFTKFAQSMVLMPKRITLYFPSLTGGGVKTSMWKFHHLFFFFFSAPSLRLEFDCV